MTQKISFFDVLGVAPSPNVAGDAAALLPEYLFGTAGYHPQPDGASRLAVATALEGALTFRNVRFGADAEVQIENAAGQISFAADVDCTGLVDPLYLQQLPDVGFKLLATVPGAPARVFATADQRGVEVIIESLPVEVHLPVGLLTPLDPKGSIVDSGTFGDKPDGFSYFLSSVESSTFTVMARFHLRTDGTVLFEPSVPVSFGRCRFTGLPVERLYDLTLIPSPERREDFEWIRHDVAGSLGAPVTGAIAVRSIDFRLSDPPFSDLKEYLGGADWKDSNLELVCEDLIFPAMMPATVPVPLHGMFGFRRKAANPGEDPFALGNAPFKFLISGKEDDGWHFALYHLLFRSGDAEDPPVVLLEATIERTPSTAGSGILPDAVTLGLSDEWTPVLGIAWGPDPPAQFQFAGVMVSLQALRAGASIWRLSEGDTLKNSLLLLGDIRLHTEPNTDEIFRIESVTGGPVDTMFRGLGWSLGKFTFGALATPSGMRVVFGNSFALLVEEWGLVEEPTGVEYFSISGGVELAFAKGEKTDGDYGLRFRRLRFRTEDVESAPPVLLDGLSLKLKFGPVSIFGLGFMTDFLEPPWRIQEWGFGVEVQVDALACQFGVAAAFFKGSRTNTQNEDQSFQYFLAALSLKFLPAGPFELLDIRALVALNLQPDAPPDGEGEGMTLYRWYKAQSDGMGLPVSRGLSGWAPVDNSFTLGLGFGFSITGFGRWMHVDFFGLVSRSEDAGGLLIVGELFVMKGPKPFAWVAFEYDFKRDKFGLMIGIDIPLVELLGQGSVPDWLKDLLRISGSIYIGNLPATFAMGQLPDQRTWLGIRAHNSWLVVIDFVFAICIQYEEGGPRGFGIVFSITGGADWGIGGFVVYGGFGLIIGVFKTGAQTTAAEIWIELGFRIHLFFVFNFGVRIELRLTYLGREPWYTTLSATIEIETPWWLPNVTVRFEKTFSEARPFETATARQALASAEGISDGDLSTEKLLTPPLDVDKELYTFVELITMATQQPNGDPPVLATTSTIVLEFSCPMTNDMAVGPDTGDAGVQKVQDLTLRYGLKSIKVRRKPRWGVGGWTDFVEESQTELPLDSGNVQTKPALSFRWDLASREDGKLSPTRLLLNAESPYTFTIGGAQADEETLLNDESLPCCPERIRKPPQYKLSFDDRNPGWQLPGSQQFANPFAKDGAWWQWTTMLPLAAPSIVPGEEDLIVARIHPMSTQSLGVVDFLDPASSVIVQLDWSLVDGKVLLDAMHGMELLKRQELDLAQPSARMYSFFEKTAKPITRFFLRIELGPQAPLDIDLQLVRVTYIKAKDQAAHDGAVARCENNGGPLGHGGAGKIAWLPNHDYEIVVNSGLELTYPSQGTQELTLTQRTFFRTKGLPGLNASKTVGDELTPFVESTYPRSTRVPLYRDEPAALAFTEGMSSLLPVDRVPLAGDPEEKAQMYELELHVRRVASLAGGESVPLEVKNVVRLATSLDIGTLRFEKLLESAENCIVEPLHSSQVLLHEPVGPEGWEPQATFRATVRRKDAPHEASAFIGGEPIGTKMVLGALTWDHIQIHARIERNGAAKAGLAIGLSDAPGDDRGVFATMEGTQLVLKRWMNGFLEGLASADLPADDAIVGMSLFAFDDRVRAVVGATTVEIDRGAVREGRAALVSDGPAKVHTLRVDPLDLYRFDFETSRYRTFEEHLATFPGTVEFLAPLAPTSTVSQWIAAHPGEIAAVVTPDADAQTRQALFTDLVTSAGIPLRQRADRVSLTLLGSHGDTLALVLESPEPLPFSRDITATLTRKQGKKVAVWTDVPFQLLTNGDETTAILIPTAAATFPKGEYKLELKLERERWRAEVADGESTLSASGTLAFTV